MVEKKKFEEAHLDKTLQDISSKLTKNTEAFLLGGLAMIKHEAKASTKDVDIVFSSEEMAIEFIRAAKETGFEPQKELEEEYIALETIIVLTKDDGTRFDIFVNEVCGCLEYTTAMRERSSTQKYGEKLTIHISSREDIFLFKAITSRPSDLEDMSILVQKGVIWNIIEKEAKQQPRSWEWIGRMYGRLIDLREEYQVISPLISNLKEDWEVSQSIGILVSKLEIKPLSLNEMQRTLQEPELAFVEKVLREMKRKNMIVEFSGKYSLS